MRRKIVAVVLFTAGMSACLLRPSSGITFYSAAPRFSPTSADQVEIFRKDPLKPNIQLGEVWVKPEPGWSLAYVETLLQQKAATIGAQAVIIIYDTFANGQVASGFGAAPRIAPANGVVGVAARYQ